MGRLRPSLTTPMLLALAVATACGRGGDPAAAAIRSLARAANDRDASEITGMLTPDFQDAHGMTREDVENELRRLFAAYASIDVSISDLSLERYPAFTLAKFRVAFRGSVRKIGGLESILPATSRYRFELRLVPEGPRFRVAHAFWEEAPG